MTTLVTPGGTLTHNAASGDTYFIDPKRSVGLGMGEIRDPMDDKAQTDGFILHDFFEKGAMLVPAGVVLARSDTTGVTGADTLMAAMVTALRSILRATGTLNFGSGAALTVKCHMRADFPSLEGDLKGFIYGLVSASPPPT
jgi:hypothetical protein